MTSNARPRVWIVILLLTLIAACDFSDNPNLKTGKGVVTLSGTGAWGLIHSGKVTVYDYSDCRAVFLGDTGTFSGNAFTIGVEIPVNTPLLLELSDYSWNAELEPIGSQPIDSLGVKMRAMIVANPATAQSVTISYWTNLAAARALHACIAEPSDLQHTIDDSNRLFSNALLFDIIHDTPQPLLENTYSPDNIKAVRYGIANAAADFYILLLNDVIANSLLFADTTYNDLAHDGRLDGILDFPIAAGNLCLCADEYRNTLATAMYYLSLNLSRKSSFSDSLLSSLLETAKSYNNSTLDVFSGAPILPLSITADTSAIPFADLPPFVDLPPYVPKTLP